MPGDRRDEMLYRMYSQMFTDIQTQTHVVWQSTTTLAGAFALLSLSEKNILPIDIAITLLILLCGWLGLHVLNASYWYNRNLAIIANIERQFLTASDLRNIHYYFGKHRRASSMERHLRIQMYLAVCLLIIVSLYHFITRVIPGFHSDFSLLDPKRSLPYIMICFTFSSWLLLWRNRAKSYKEFIANSPGIPIDASGLVYGSGHPSEP